MITSESVTPDIGALLQAMDRVHPDLAVALAKGASATPIFTAVIARRRTVISETVSTISLADAFTLAIKQLGPDMAAPVFAAAQPVFIMGWDLSEEEAKELCRTPHGAAYPLLQKASGTALCFATADVAAKDKARLDFLDECNARLNARFGTNYGWELILNHNVNRLMMGRFAVDLSDDKANGFTSCRDAIDQAMERVAKASDFAQEGHNIA